VSHSLRRQWVWRVKKNSVWLPILCYQWRIFALFIAMKTGILYNLLTQCPRRCHNCLFESTRSISPYHGKLLCKPIAIAMDRANFVRTSHTWLTSMKLKTYNYLPKTTNQNSLVITYHNKLKTRIDYPKNM